MKNIYIVFVVLLTIQFQLPNYNQGNYVLRVRDNSSQYFIKVSDEVTNLPSRGGVTTIDLLEHIDGNRYRLLNSSLHDSDESDWTESCYPLYWKEDDLHVKIAQILDAPNDYDTVVSINNYLMNRLTYKKMNHPSLFLPSADTVLKNGEGQCYDFAILFGSMLRSAGIPTQLVLGNYQGVYHAWNRVYIDGEWHDIDITRNVAYGELQWVTGSKEYIVLDKF